MPFRGTRPWDILSLCEGVTGESQNNLSERTPKVQGTASLLGRFLETEVLQQKRSTKSSENNLTRANVSAGQSPYSECLDIIVEDFFRKKQEVLKLNPSRRKLIEGHIARRSDRKHPVTLDCLVSARIGTPEQIGFEKFVLETATFQLCQFFLVKKWFDMGLLSKQLFMTSGKRLNWQISSYLKKAAPQQMLTGHQWAFLRINIYSWFSMSTDVWSNLLHFTKDTDLSETNSDFLGDLLFEVAQSRSNADIGFYNSSLFSKLPWELLGRQKQIDEQVDEIGELKVGDGEANSAFLTGLLNGQSFSSIQCINPNSNLKSLYSFARNEFEQYMGEIVSLWSLSRHYVPENRIFHRDQLDPSKQDKTTLTNQLFRKGGLPGDTNFLACFPDYETENNVELTDFIELVRKVRESGCILVASDSYWITDRDELHQEIRKSCLEHTSLRLIVDMRHMVNQVESLQIPRCMYLLERHSSKEYRDSNRPRIIKVRGKIDNCDDLASLWQSILTHLDARNSTGEVQVVPIQSSTKGMRIEVMWAATTQAQLGTAPWLSLAEPAFYKISSTLKRHPFRVAQQGVLLPPQRSSNMSQSLRRGVYFSEIPGKALICEGTSKSNSEASDSKALKHIFVPDIDVKESPKFFEAMFNSSVVQFWYCLEWEQNCYGLGTRSKSRQSENLLKMMPVAQIFRYDSDALLPVIQPRPIDSLAKVRKEVIKLCDSTDWTTEETLALHQHIIDLEENTQCHIGIAREYTAHLFPHMNLTRWNIPTQLPKISPNHVIRVLEHLQQAPIKQHPSINISFLKKATDFKVSESKLRQGGGSFDELILYSGPEAMLRIQGPKILMEAINEDIVRKAGRPWTEIAQRLQYPLDVDLMSKQLNEFFKLTEQEINLAKESAQINDFVFCRLFGLNTDQPNHGDAKIIRNHLTPNTVTVSLNLPKLNTSEPIDPVLPKAIETVSSIEHLS